MSTEPLLFRAPVTRRYLVFKSAESQHFLCVCAATSPSHALRIARQNGFTLTKTAYAKPEPQIVDPIAA